MALTYTPSAELGRALPRFSLPTVDGQTWSSKQAATSKACVVMFICNHCPYVKAVEDRLLALARDYSAKGVQFVGICSNDWADHPEDEPRALFARWKEKDYGFPYLIDEDQSVAKSFDAVCTPDIFVFDRRQTLAYRGRLDDSWKDSKKVERQELKIVLDSILAGTQPSEPQVPSMGCSIKWK